MVPSNNDQDRRRSIQNRDNRNNRIIPMIGTVETLGILQESKRKDSSKFLKVTPGQFKYMFTQ